MGGGQDAMCGLVNQVGLRGIGEGLGGDYGLVDQVGLCGIGEGLGRGLRTRQSCWPVWDWGGIGEGLGGDCGLVVQVGLCGIGEGLGGDWEEYADWEWEMSMDEGGWRRQGGAGRGSEELNGDLRGRGTGDWWAVGIGWTCCGVRSGWDPVALW